MVVLTASWERKLFSDRSWSRAWTKFLGVGQDGDEVDGLGSWCRELGQVFQLAVEEDGWLGEFFSREAEGGAKEDLGRPASGEGHPCPCIFGGSGRWPGVREPFG